MADAVMIQGTASDAGKSILAAALCRVLAQDGYKTAPFKSQNMSLNSYITKEGREIAVAQAVQAEAAKVEAEINMSPILMKPIADDMSQIILKGKVYKNMKAAAYFAEKDRLLQIINEAISELKTDYDLLVLEGGGNPAEVNLRDKDLVNMKAAEIAEAPVILIADIDKGGVFASIVGTLDLLTEKERKRVKGIIVNKFRGDPDAFKSGVELIEKHSQKKVLGVMPYLKDLNLPSEDSLQQKDYGNQDFKLIIAVIAYPGMSNFTDFDYFKSAKDIQMRYVKRAAELGNPDLIILPGSKTTINDLKFLYNTNLAAEILKQADKGTEIIGICGGYQMLGQKISDPDNLEGNEKEIEGLSLLKIKTVLEAEKITRQVRAEPLNKLNFFKNSSGRVLSGYEIHQGKTVRASEQQAIFRLKRQKSGEVEKIVYDGTVNESGNVWGTYLHDIFKNDDFRKSLINYLLSQKGLSPNLEAEKTAAEIREDNYNYLAAEFRKYIDLEELYKIIFDN
ncbi:adenosylcobyric acid synthase (glutamine-hydrolysing) [Halanaerobium saccharolyticum]|uniref:Cobyric acid synthase n=1 Tax=Halanaerobium saccharolyticum TaxID=43595 RepID=A0A4R7Z7S1_9FIRM|nr:cobyric acid synthase [Halanaerobium saccharolyticum]RAK10596.1 adenosylcobyric acid synthase (glutamine-hydrolysing) [Halanaerobium saccharolyticum]TDW06647.1 adenosylcobyric acid synthase (glutamine-hydrolysing) [Halanaerobium saccharolyticum]TDX62282.1 adenosylcobyric acid synthase (glutamine-hydrolysing) [Halanaerobium saccharolyticum]